MCDSTPCQGARQCGQFRWGGPQVLMPKWDHPRFSLQNAACRVGCWCRKRCVCIRGHGHWEKMSGSVCKTLVTHQGAAGEGSLFVLRCLKNLPGALMPCLLHPPPELQQSQLTRRFVVLPPHPLAPVTVQVSFGRLVVCKQNIVFISCPVTCWQIKKNCCFKE